MKRAARHQAIDRRILSAFYTQYVAVLLIVLVMSVSIFSAPKREIDLDTSAMPNELSRFVGSEVLAASFSESGQELLHTGELEAIATTLQQHDLRATFRLGSRINGGADLQEGLHKLELIRVFMQQRGVPSNAVRTVLSDSDAHLKVSYEIVETRNGL